MGGPIKSSFFAMGVLRLGTGMESIEFIPGLKITKFFGKADLGNIQKKDGAIFSYSDVPFSIVGDNSKIRLKGNEGVHLEGKKLKCTANQDLYLKTLNGSTVLDGGAGIFIEVNTLPLAGPTNQGNGRGQYKLCVCLPKRQLFRVPVPTDNNERAPSNQINCATFSNPCMKT